MKRPNIKIMIKSMKIKRSKTTLPVSLRKATGEIFYQQSKLTGMTTPLHKEVRLKDWDHWAIIDNAFPYNAAFKVHHMLIPKRQVTESELSDVERKELDKILKIIGDEYDCYLVNFKSKQSIKSHYHIHLMTYKDSRSELKF